VSTQLTATGLGLAVLPEVVPRLLCAAQPLASLASTARCKSFKAHGCHVVVHVPYTALGRARHLSTLHQAGQCTSARIDHTIGIHCIRQGNNHQHHTIAANIASGRATHISGHHTLLAYLATGKATRISIISAHSWRTMQQARQHMHHYILPVAYIESGRARHMQRGIGRGDCAVHGIAGSHAASGKATHIRIMMCHFIYVATPKKRHISRAHIASGKALKPHGGAMSS
jgi:hypothetical protein